MSLAPAEARDIAVQVAGAAAATLREGWGRVGEIRAKEQPTDLVTEWDERVERQVIADLTSLTPGVAILGEELGSRGPAGRERWVVNPVDGTVNFAHGLPLFGVSIGYELDGVPVAGAVAAPALGWLFAAAQGEGATRNGEPIHVSAVPELGRAMLVTGFPYDRQVSPRNNFDAFVHMQRRAGAVRRLGAASLDLCFVACGWFDGYWEFKLKPWDLSAGAIIVAEAGGQVSLLDGGDFRSDACEILASNGRLHAAMIAELEGRT